MRNIIESIKNNREELISKYSKMKGEKVTLSEEIDKAIKLGNTDTMGKLRVKCYEIESEMFNIGSAIDCLTNALNHLGEKAEIFWENRR